jgi:DNA-binding transcriptional LysR family regulator
MDWDDVRFFLAVARRRTLSAAARDLAVTQPTVGRRITAFERRLGAKLYIRRSGGFELTGAGTHMLEHAERMERDALAAERAVAGRDAGLRGVVRVTASEWLITSVVSPMMGALFTRYPQLELELVADQRHLNLSRREADIALRPRRFAQQALLQRATVTLGFGLYAAPRYLATRGTPRAGGGDIARDWLATAFPAATRAVRTNGRDAMVSLAAAGVGMACLARVVGDEVRALHRLPTPIPPPAPTLWLGMAREASTTPRVRAVASFLTEGLRAIQHVLAPLE